MGMMSALSQSSEEALRTLLNSKSLEPTTTAVYIRDLDNDYIVTSYNETTPVIPASVMKCVTVGALSYALPYNTTLKTDVFLEGKKHGDGFQGTITVVGSGDPSLGDGRHKEQPDITLLIIEALKKRGITDFAGEIKIDDTLFAGPPAHPSWPAADLKEYYGTGCHAFNFEGNASGKRAIADPAAVFRRKLISAMRENGIEYNDSLAMKADKTSKRQKIVEYESPRLGDLMRSCMFRSDNLYAESFLRLFGVMNGTDGSADLSSKMAMQHWDAMNYNLDAVNITDGSGLSRDNRLSAEFLGSVLEAKHSDPEYVALFPLVGEEGTVRSFMKDTQLQGRLALKTGSMNGIQSYAGYLLDEDYMPTHVVVVMTNGLKNRGEFRNALSRFFQTVLIKAD